LTLCLPFRLKKLDGRNWDDLACKGLPDMASRPTAPLNRLRRADRRPKAPLPPRLRAGPHSNQSGFALVAVIWSLGLITLLGMAVIVGAKYRTKVTSSMASVAAATAAAESAINLGIAVVLTTTPAQNVKFPLRCRMPRGERVTVTLEEETGKVDLNTATPAVLTRLFTALTFDQSSAARITQRIVEFRDPAGGKARNAGAPSSGGQPGPDNSPRFTTIMQLDGIEGVSPSLFRAALRFVTVRSGRPEPDADAASPALRALSGFEPKSARPTRAAPTAGSVTIRADVRAPDGARFVREALVSLGAENGRPFVVREWRHGDIDATTVAPSQQASDNSCLRIGNGVGS
jgi:general secretion pathway protein K